MAFTQKEIDAWHRGRRTGSESSESSEAASAGLAECLHCGRSFHSGEGNITSEAAICDICND